MAQLLPLLLLLSSVLFAMDRQAGGDYRARRVALAAGLKGGVALVFAPMESDGPNAVYGWRQENNFYYLTGWAEPGAAVLISPAVEASGKQPARPYEEVLFLPAHNRIQERWTGPKLGPDDPGAAAQVGFDRVASLDDLHEVLSAALADHNAIYTTLAKAPETTASTAPMEWLRRTNAIPMRVGLQDVTELIAELRKHKDAGELERIRKATNASMMGHRAAMQVMQPGLYEYQIAALMQYKYENEGCERAAYAPIVGTGLNSTVLHYSENTAEIKDGDVVVIDVAGEYGMYASDITRTLPANGHFTDRQREIYNVVLGAQQAAFKAVAPGRSKLTGRDEDSLYKVAWEYINTHGKDLHGEPLGKYFIHGLGHRVGLEVHDVGSGPVDKGDVFTIEPGIYIPEEKIGVRLEDIVMIDESGKVINLTAELPHTAEDVEAAMKR